MQYKKNQKEIFKIYKLKELCDIKYGKSIEANKLSFNCKFKVYGGNGVIGTLDTYDHINYKISISCRGAASGKVILTEPYSTISSNSLFLNLFDEKHFFNILMFLKNANLSNIATGSAQPQITIANIEDLEIKIYNNFDNSIYEKLIKIKSQTYAKITILNKLKQTYLCKFFK